MDGWIKINESQVAMQKLNEIPHDIFHVHKHKR